MWKQIKPKVTGVVMWAIRNHWMLLIAIISFQYFSGKAMSEGSWFFNLKPRTLLMLHNLNGTLIFITMLLLAAEKGYLWLLKKGKI